MKLRSFYIPFGKEAVSFRGSPTQEYIATLQREHELKLEKEFLDLQEKADLYCITHLRLGMEGRTVNTFKPIYDNWEGWFGVPSKEVEVLMSDEDKVKQATFILNEVKKVIQIEQGYEEDTLGSSFLREMKFKYSQVYNFLMDVKQKLNQGLGGQQIIDSWQHQPA